MSIEITRVVDRCTHCGSRSFVKNGTGKNGTVQHYKCKECGLSLW